VRPLPRRKLSVPCCIPPRPVQAARHYDETKLVVVRFLDKALIEAGLALCNEGWLIYSR